MSKFIIKTGLVSLFLSLLTVTNALSQETKDVTSLIKELDIEFWDAYNRCDVDNMSKFFTDDMEFYHDKHGLTSTKVAMVASIKDGLCAGRENVRREKVDGTIQIYPLKTYGAVISGDHLFYVSQNGGPERLAEQAKFTHIWKQEGDSWKMSRVISYDHKPPTSKVERVTVELTHEQLDLLSGKYKAPNTGDVTIEVVESNLFMKAGEMMMTLYPEQELLFYSKDAPLQFQFVLDNKRSVTKFIVIENGTPVEEAMRIEE